MFSDDFRMIFGNFRRFPEIPGRLGMFPDDSRAFQIVFGAFRSSGSPGKSDLFNNVSGGVELTLKNKRSFEVWRTAVFERSESERSEVRAKRGPVRDLVVQSSK